MDCILFEFDREDQVGTLYRDIKRLPAGHAIKVVAGGVKTWRYWDPSNLSPLSFASLEECAEAFVEQMRIAVKCRLRSIGPVAAMLSGGLDSTSVVGLISKEFRDELAQPLRTFSLIREDRENCPDWSSIGKFLEENAWIDAKILTSDISAETCQEFLAGVRNADEPFEITHGLTARIIFEAAGASGCRAIFDGLAGDLLFYGYERSLQVIFQRKMYRHLPAVLRGGRRHGRDPAETLMHVTRHMFAALAPARVGDIYREMRDSRALRKGGAACVYTTETKRLLSEKLALRRQAAATAQNDTDQAVHAQFFTSGLISFAHEIAGAIALSAGVEPRSPLSDRRMIEFAIRMPVEAKLHAGWYKNLLRESMQGFLPEEVRWRRNITGHPGWKFHQSLFEKAVDVSPEICDLRHDHLARWFTLHGYANAGSYEQLHERFRLSVSGFWLSENGIALG